MKRNPWLIWFMFKKDLLMEPRPLHKDWGKKTQIGQFDLFATVLILTRATGWILMQS
jgi:hypothetical protein